MQVGLPQSKLCPQPVLFIKTLCTLLFQHTIYILHAASVPYNTSSFSCMLRSVTAICCHCTYQNKGVVSLPITAICVHVLHSQDLKLFNLKLEYCINIRYFKGKFVARENSWPIWKLGNFRMEIPIVAKIASYWSILLFFMIPVNPVCNDHVSCL